MTALNRTKQAIVNKMTTQLKRISDSIKNVDISIEQFEDLRHEWAEVGVSLSGHVTIKKDTDSTDDAYDRAMDILK